MTTWQKGKILFDFFLGHYSYWLTIMLLCIGLYGVLMKKNLVKKTIGLTILQSSIILFFVSIAAKWNATVPIFDPSIPVADVSNYLNPLPHTLMLTAIVVGVATLGVAFALLMSIFNRYQSLDEQEILDMIE
ncbi:MAG TPA: NADH-quinone oxidoreductase subunit J [Desulfobacteraceae bacterium]|jgi:multicomponent Na+:H+ antiporter subunit C|nr:NADH-quinone oxidoreductase subunit J [Desulfobacteraceae bacterium]